MTGPPDFKTLVSQVVDERRCIQSRNLLVREQIASALQAGQEDRAPWEAVPADGEIAENVTKRLNVSCGDAFRVHLVIYDGDRVLCPKPESGEACSASDSAEALIEIARRFALHQLPDVAIVARRSMTAR